MSTNVLTAEPRPLSLVDAITLLVNASEGPLPQSPGEPCHPAAAGWAVVPASPAAENGGAW